MNLVAEHSILTLGTVLLEFGDVFSGVGCLPGEYHIDLDLAVPSMLNRPRKIPHTMWAAVEGKLKSSRGEWNYCHCGPAHGVD